MSINIYALKLNNKQIKAVLKDIPIECKQARRMFEHLANTPNSPTGKTASVCAIGNLSDIALKANPHIYKHGYFISCFKPPVRIINKFNEESNQFLWGVFEVQKAANDDNY